MSRLSQIVYACIFLYTHDYLNYIFNDRPTFPRYATPYIHTRANFNNCGNILLEILLLITIRLMSLIIFVCIFFFLFLFETRLFFPSPWFNWIPPRSTIKKIVINIEDCEISTILFSVYIHAYLSYPWFREFQTFRHFVLLVRLKFLYWHNSNVNY